MEGPVEWRPGECGRGRRFPLLTHPVPTLWRIRFRALMQFPQFAVVVVNVPQRPWAQYREQFLGLWRDHPIEPVGGKLIQWP